MNGFIHSMRFSLSDLSVKINKPLINSKQHYKKAKEQTLKINGIISVQIKNRNNSFKNRILFDFRNRKKLISSKTSTLVNIKL